MTGASVDRLVELTIGGETFERVLGFTLTGLEVVISVLMDSDPSAITGPFLIGS